jgi:hypothetical protein
MKKVLSTLLVCVTASTIVFASGSIRCNGDYPVVDLNYSPGGDPPGLFYVGVQGKGSAQWTLLTSGGWQNYRGGSIPYYSQYSGPVSLTISLPNGEMSTRNYVGYSIYLGHGAFTLQAADVINQALARTNTSKTILAGQSLWSQDMENMKNSATTNAMRAAVENDLLSNGKMELAITIPFLDCSPPPPPPTLP